MGMYATYCASEEAAKSRIAAWAANTRADWSVGPVETIRRDASPEYVAPFERHLVGGGPLVVVQVRATGPFARRGEEWRGQGAARQMFCWPAA